MPTLQTKRHLLFSVLMGALMTGVVSFVLTALNTGLNARFMAVWLPGYAVAFVCASPIIYVAAPKLRALVERMVRQ